MINEVGLLYVVLAAILIIVPRVLAKRWAARYNKYKPLGRSTGGCTIRECNTDMRASQAYECRVNN